MQRSYFRFKRKTNSKSDTGSFAGAVEVRIFGEIPRGQNGPTACPRGMTGSSGTVNSRGGSLGES